LPGGYAYSNFTLSSGNTWVVTWQTDSPVSVYIFNPSQYSTVKLLGVPITALDSKLSTPSGSLSYQVPQDGFYYVVITNPNGLQNVVNVASYKSELQWQEQVTKYRTETQYKTETIYTSSTLGINLGIAVLVLGSILTALSFVNLKSIMTKTKNLNTVTCDYCNTTYKKNLDKCPHCGARKKTD
jgi:redox-regulated HSP33 family molecular chaperone